MRPLVVALVFLASAGCTSVSVPRYLVLATTTSVGNSGLLEALLPAWTAESGVEVRVSLAGSGRALRMLEAGQADAAITHAPSTESAFLARHPPWTYVKVMFTDFVLVGPEEDPSRVAAASTVAAAMRQIAGGPAVFLSRADESGTHEREQALWALAGVEPPALRVIPSGTGMATTLRQADERGGYTLADRPTFDQLRQRLRLRVVFEGGAELLNPYAVLTSSPDAPARDFAQWLTDGAGRVLISRFEVTDGRPAYRVWPHDRPRDRPDAMPF